MRRYATFIQVPGTQPTSPATGTLACGYDSTRGGWIVEVDPHCISSNYADRGFHAVGSAAGFAHFRPAERPLSQGRLIAYRVINAAIQASMFGVGGDIQMWYVDASDVHQVGKDQMDQIRDLVGGWQDDEGRLFDRTFGSEAPPAEPAAPPPSETEPKLQGNDHGILGYALIGGTAWPQLAGYSPSPTSFWVDTPERQDTTRLHKSGSIRHKVT